MQLVVFYGLPVNVQGMVRKPEVVFQAGVFNDFPNSRIVKFHNLAR